MASNKSTDKIFTNFTVTLPTNEHLISDMSAAYAGRQIDGPSPFILVQVANSCLSIEPIPNFACEVELITYIQALPDPAALIQRLSPCRGPGSPAGFL